MVLDWLVGCKLRDISARDLPHIGEVGGEVDDECTAKQRGAAERWHGELLLLVFWITFRLRMMKKSVPVRCSTRRGRSHLVVSMPKGDWCCGYLLLSDSPASMFVI